MDSAFHQAFAAAAQQRAHRSAETLRPLRREGTPDINAATPPSSRPTGKRSLFIFFFLFFYNCVSALQVLVGGAWLLRSPWGDRWAVRPEGPGHAARAGSPTGPLCRPGPGHQESGLSCRIPVVMEFPRCKRCMRQQRGSLVKCSYCKRRWCLVLFASPLR